MNDLPKTSGSNKGQQAVICPTAGPKSSVFESWLSSYKSQLAIVCGNPTVVDADPLDNTARDVQPAPEVTTTPESQARSQQQHHQHGRG